jgi:hypothetical protein
MHDYYLYYLRRVLDVSFVLSHELAHVESIVDRSGWLLVALYNGKMVIYLQHRPMYCTCMICIHKFPYVPASYDIFLMAAFVSMTRTFHL